MTGSRFSVIAVVLVCTALAGLSTTGCGSSHGVQYRKDTSTWVQEELDYWHALRGQITGREVSVPRSTHGAAPRPVPVVPMGGSIPHRMPAVGMDEPLFHPTPRASQFAESPGIVRDRDVVLCPGDVIEVKFFYTPELDVTQMVRPDGKIALQLVGEIIVEGKTPAEVRDELLGRYQSHLKNPKITILLKSQYDRRVFVGGEVTRPGVIEMPGDMTIAQAIMEAGGFDLQEAKVDNVIVIRRKGPRWQGYKLDMKPTLEGYAVEPFFLHPKDIVYVPRTKIAQIDQWVDQHINKLIPRIPFYFSLPLNQ